MTELQVTINNLKEVIIAADLVLQELKAEQKDPKKPEFPQRFFAAKDTVYSDVFVIGLKKDSGILKEHDELPLDFLGRTCFSMTDIRQIIIGLQTLLGESNG